MDESVINFKKASCDGASFSSNLCPPLVERHTPPFVWSHLPTKNTPPTMAETVSDHAAADSWKSCVWRLHVVVGGRDSGPPVRTYIARQSDVRAPFVIVTSSRRVVTVRVVRVFSLIFVYFSLKKFLRSRPPSTGSDAFSTSTRPFSIISFRIDNNILTPMLFCSRRGHIATGIHRWLSFIWTVVSCRFVYLRIYSNI